jgi:transposase-like protein
MINPYNDCSVCDSSNLVLKDSSYKGEWTEQDYKCEECGKEQTTYFDFVYYLPKIKLNPTTNETTTNTLPKLQTSS